MSKIIRNLFILVFVVLVAPSYALAQGTPLPEKCSSAGKCYTPLSSITTLFANILSVVVILAGFAAFAMLVFGGFRFIIAQGDPKAVQAARGTITWAVVGLVMIIVSWLVLLFISQFTGLNLTQFCFGVKSNGDPCY